MAPINKNHLSTSTAVIEQYARDPLVYTGNVRVRTGHETMRAIAEALTAVRAGHLGPTPALILHGEDDLLVNIAGSRELMALLEGSKDKTMVAFPGLKHELLSEPGPRGGAEVLRVVVEWLAAHGGA